MKKIFLLFAICNVLVSSCKKESSSAKGTPKTIDSKICGVVSDSVTSSLLSGIRLYLVKHDISDYSSFSEIIDSTISESDGSYQFTKALLLPYSVSIDEGPTYYHTVKYNVLAETSEYYRYYTTLSDPKDTLKMNLALKYAGFMRVHFKNLYGQYAGISFSTEEIFWNDGSIILKYPGDTIAEVNYQLFNEDKKVYNTSGVSGYLTTGVAKKGSFSKWVKAQDTLSLILEY